MPDEIGWPSASDEALADEARAAARRAHPLTSAEKAEIERRCEAARLYRERRDQKRQSRSPGDS